MYHYQQEVISGGDKSREWAGADVLFSWYVILFRSTGLIDPLSKLESMAPSIALKYQYLKWAVRW